MSLGPTPLAAVAKGLLAGVAGTAAMTAAQTAAAKARGGSEPSTTPAQVGKRIIEGVLQRGPVGDDQIPALNTAMHWLYGTSWGAVYGLAQGTRHARISRGGPAFGTFVWSASLIELPAMKLAPPVWEYPPAGLAEEVGYHLVYGLGVAAAYAALRG